MSDAEEVAILIHRAEQLGFNIVDLYMPDGDEVIAFTCSKSKEYIEAISKVDPVSQRAPEA